VTVHTIKPSLFALVLMAVAGFAADADAQYRITLADVPARGSRAARPTRPAAAQLPASLPQPAARQVRPALARHRASEPQGSQADGPSAPTPARGAAPEVPEVVAEPEVVGDVMDDATWMELDETPTPGCEPCRAPGYCYLPNGWVQGEYLLWWPRAMDIPALVTSGTAASEGVLDQPGTQTLVGGQLMDETFSGARLRLGLWTDACRDKAWVAEAFVIGERTYDQSFSGSGAQGTSVLAVPFFNVLTSQTAPNGEEDAQWIAFPGQVAGTVRVEASSRLLGVSVHHLRSLCQSCGCGPPLVQCDPCRSAVCVQTRLGAFLGWRYLDLSESLAIHENLTSLLPAPDNGQFLIRDQFATGNLFNGADLGVLWQGQRGVFSLDLLMRLALGSTHQRVQIAGNTSVRGSSDAGNNFENAPGGVFAQRTNIGEYARNRFAVVPELGVTVGCALTPQWRATLGYTFLYWSSVVRPGDQMDRDLNPNLFPPESAPLAGLLRPEFDFVESDLWVQGLSVGLERTW
jgi:hypothetical protein